MSGTLQRTRFVRFTVSFTVAAVLAICGPLPADETGPFTLRYRFAPNESLHYQVTHNNEMFAQFGEAKNTDTNKVEERKHIKVVSVDDDGSAVLQIVFDHIRMEARFGEADAEPITFDSSQPKSEDPSQFGNVRRVIDQPPAPVRVNSVGQLIADNGKPDGSATDAGKENFLVVLPEKPVRIGEAWTDVVTTKVSVNKEISRNVEILRTYRLKAVRDGIAEISLSTSLRSTVRDPKMLAQLIQSKPSGSIFFNIDRGRIVQRTAVVKESVLNALGANSLLRANSTRVEKLVDAPRTAIRQTGAQK